MAFEIKTEVMIKVKPQKVWSILTNFKEYSSWNPFIRSINGAVSEGNSIEVFIVPPESKGMTFKPKVLSFNKNEEFSWLGHLLFKGFFDGLHQFKLIDNKDGTTTFIQSENFKGILVPLFKKQLNSNTRNGFIQMNEELKKLAES